MSQTTTMTIVLLAALLMTASVVSGQEAPPLGATLFCGTNLCASAQAGGTPSKACCYYLEVAVHLPCFCDFITNQQELAGLNLTTEEALGGNAVRNLFRYLHRNPLRPIPKSTTRKQGHFPAGCFMNAMIAGASMCSTSAAAPAKAPLPHGVPPVAGPSPTNAKKGGPSPTNAKKGDASKLAGTGLVGIVAMAISMILY